MRNASILVRNLAATAALSTLLAGCVVYPAGGYYGATVGYAPPPLQVETVGVAPVPGYFWIGGRYSWVPGRWSAPRPGYHWAAPRWERHGNGWRINRGGWRR